MRNLRLCAAPLLALLLLACSSRAPEGYKIALVPERLGQNGIFVLNSDTSGGKLLTPDPTAQLRASSWSPDGKRIVFFAAMPQDSHLLEKYGMPSHFLLYSINAAGGIPKRLLDFPVSTFSFSPDGSELLLTSAYEDPAHDENDVISGKRTPMSAAYLVNLETGKKRRVTGFGRQCYGSWSPDGSRLAISFGNETGSDIHIVGLDGKHARRINGPGAVNLKPAWSPDGKSIAFITVAPHPDKGIVANAYLADAQGGNTRKVADVTAYEVSWSKDSKYLLLQSAEGVTLASVEGGGMLSLAKGSVEPRDAVFTPDGREVMFRSNHEGVWHLYAVDLKGANLRRLTGNLSVSTFCLSPSKQ